MPSQHQGARIVWSCLLENLCLVEVDPPEVGVYYDCPFQPKLSNHWYGMFVLRETPTSMVTGDLELHNEQAKPENETCCSV